MPLDTSTLKLHANHPAWVWVVVEQPRGERFRVEFSPSTGIFSRSESLSLLCARGFTGLYGWIGGTGAPPGSHHDVMVLSQSDAQSGDILEARICGMFKRADGDNKFVAIGLDIPAQGEPDLFQLPKALQDEVYAVYLELGDGEAWLGGDAARTFLMSNAATHD